MISAPCAITHPTRGLGWVVSSPRAASIRARFIAKRSKSENMSACRRALPRVFPSPLARIRSLTRRSTGKQRQLIAAGRARRGAFARARLRELRRAARLTARIARSRSISSRNASTSSKLPIDRGKAHVGNFVQMTQLLHHELADGARRHLALAEAAQLVNTRLDRCVDAARALTGRFSSAFSMPLRSLRSSNRFAAAIALDHQRHQQLGGLEGREALATAQTLAPAADLAALAGEARVRHLGLYVAAEGTMHRLPRAPAFSLRAVHREATAQLEHLRPHPLDDACGAFRRRARRR